GIGRRIDALRRQGAREGFVEERAQVRVALDLHGARVGCFLRSCSWGHGISVPCSAERTGDAATFCWQSGGVSAKPRASEREQAYACIPGRKPPDTHRYVRGETGRLRLRAWLGRAASA